MFRFMSIRTQIVVLIVLMTLLPLGLIVYNAVKQQRHDTQEAFATSAIIAARIQSDQNILLAGIDQLAATVSILPSVRQHDAAAVNSMLAELIKFNPRILNISIMDRNGRIWASGLPATNTPTYADRRFFINTVATGKPASGEYTLGRTLKIPFMTFGYPIKDSTGRVSDVMAVLIPLDSYSKLYSGEHTSPVSAILLTDHKGTILFSSTDPSLVGTQDRPDLFRRMAERPTEGSFEAVGILGVKRLYSYRAVTLKNETSPYMFIRSGLGKEHVLKKTRQDLLSSVGILLLTMFLMFCLVIYLCKKGILDKVSALREATRKIAGGDLDIRVSDHVDGGDFGALGLAFDDMAQRLREADTAKRESENKYRELVENASSIILRIDTEGRIIFFNEYAQRFFGYSEAEVLGRSVLGTIVPETETSGRSMAGLVKDILDQPGMDSISINENICKDGTRVWVSWNNHTLVNADGSKAGMLSIGQDITEQKKFEEKLKKSEERFRAFVENANDVVFALTPAGEFSYVSPNWTEAFGYALEETIGKPFPPFVHPDDVPGCLEFMRRVFETGQKQSGVEYRVRSRSGEYLWYKANASLIHDPTSGALTLIGIGRDISGLKAAEETLRQSEERFSAAFHASPDAITLSRLGNGIYLNVNEGFTDLTGYLPEEAIGKSAIELNIWDSHLDRVGLLLELREHGKVTGKQFEFRRKDGSKRIGQMAARIIEIGREPCLLAITRDITMHEQLQKELIKAQKLDSISILAGGIAHNFNNVLTGVIGYISYAKKHLHEPEKLSQTLEAAEKSSHRAAGIARQLLTFSQSTTPVRKPVSIDALVRESVELFLSGSNVTGIVDCAAHQAISVDSQQISQAFNNIVLNALQAMPNGGTLTVTAQSVQLGSNNHYLLPAGSYTKVIFKDTGCGISPDDLQKVYDPYFTTRDSGTGLGLSTTHSIISKHGGHIDIASEVGRGTNVSILLPSTDEEPAESGSAASPAEHVQSRGLILVMDDEKMIREVTEEVLRNAGFEVVSCPRGEDAVAVYKNLRESGKPCALSILDLSVPDGMGGGETAQRILGLDPHARIIAVSGYANDPAIADFRAFGFSGAIAKPYNSEELIAAVRKAIGQDVSGS